MDFNFVMDSSIGELREAREIIFLVTDPRLIPSIDCNDYAYIRCLQLLKQVESSKLLSNCRFLVFLPAL